MQLGHLRRLVLATGLVAVLGACSSMGMGSSVTLGGNLSGSQEVPRSHLPSAELRAPDQILKQNILFRSGVFLTF